ncbi:hypothetical protein [Pseudochrobactrum kiredjianiae]|uniref:Uncharacterized protein n=1 Tax=Pseudochrobactrum kiredjianiae TaxID=386305 RepID=A0ABW3V4A2_9HYPH|nr:hypothetical protein [Pseudochrobactrum kiredjianiae]MDM7853211.1 hypothetical protein [Pseudochrobactrum kiredjianiae]
MMFFTKKFLCVLLLLFVGGEAFGNSVPSTTKLEGRPSNVPENYFATPGGYVHPKCIVTVEDNETIKSNGTIIRADGSERSIADCDHIKYTKYGKEIGSIDSEIDVDNREIGGWEASISHQLQRDNGVHTIIGEWSVPHNPRSVGRQTLFLFNSIQTNDSIIIQPVLGFNQAGAEGPQWSIASWAVGPNLCTNGYCKSVNTKVQPGDIIKGTLTRDIPFGTDPQTVKKWRITISVLRNGVETGSQSLNVELPTSNYKSFDEAVYETYDAQTCGQIIFLDNFSELQAKFITKKIAWRHGYPSLGQAEAFNYDRKCGVETKISEDWSSEIYYGTLN